MPALVLFCLLVSYTPLFEYLNLKSFDVLLRLSPRRPVARRVLVVGIDDTSIRRIGRVPWDRSVIAQLIDRIDAGRPAAIAIDLFFDTPEPSDAALAAAIKRSGRVLLPVALVSAQAEAGEPKALSRWVQPLPEFEPAAEGHANSTPDSDGICRRLTLSRSANGRRFWALALELCRLVEGKSAPLHELNDSLDLGALTIPGRREEGYNVLIHYGSDRSPIPIISAADVLSGGWDAKAAEAAVVLLGIVSPLEADQLFTPVSTSGQPMPGVLIHANAVNMFLENSFLVEASQAVGLIAILIGVALALALMQWSRSPWHWIGLILLIAATIAAACGWFWFRGYVLPLPTLLFSILTAAAAFHVQRLASVRHALRSEVFELAEKLPHTTTHAGSVPLIEQALDLLRRQLHREWLELRFRSGQKELKHFQSGSREQSPVEGIDSVEFSEAEFTAQLIYSGSHHDSDVGLRDRLGRAITHELVSHFRILEVRSGSPQWGDLLRRGYDQWQLNVLRQIGTEWFDNDSGRRAVLECMGSGILLLDITGRVHFANPTAMRLLPFLGPSQTRIEFFDVLRREELLGADESARYPGTLSAPGFSFEAGLHCNRWPRPDLLLQCSSIHTADGTYLGSIVSVADQTDQKKLDAARQEMTALVAHELRTPLASIHGFAQQLERYALNPERVRRVAEIILRESSRLDQMTRSYLDLTRLEQQAASAETKPVNLAKPAAAALEGMMAAAESNEIELLMDCLDEDLWVCGNADFLERAVSNLLSNSIKYGGKETQVHVRVFADGRYAQCRIVFRHKQRLSV